MQTLHAALHTADELTQLNDLELARHAYALVSRLHEVHGDEPGEPGGDVSLVDRFNYAVAELLERFAPHIAKAELEVCHAGIGSDERDREIGDVLDSMERRSLLRRLRA